MARRVHAGTPALVALQRAGVPHSVHAYDHDPARQDFGQEAAEGLGVPAESIFKTLLAYVDAAPVVAIVPVTGMLDLKALAAARGAKRAHLVEASAAERITGYVVGGISPLGQRVGLPTVIDETARDHSLIYVSAGRRGLDVGLSPHDLIRLTQAQVARVSTVSARG